MELISESVGKRSRGVLVCADITPFKSIVDGSIITGRRALREHNKRNDVTFAEDYKDDWAARAKERDKMYSGDPGFDRKRRIEAIKDSIEKHSSRRGR